MDTLSKRMSRALERSPRRSKSSLAHNPREARSLPLRIALLRRQVENQRVAKDSLKGPFRCSDDFMRATYSAPGSASATRTGDNSDIASRQTHQQSSARSNDVSMEAAPGRFDASAPWGSPVFVSEGDEAVPTPSSPRPAARQLPAASDSPYDRDTPPPGLHSVSSPGLTSSSASSPIRGSIQNEYQPASRLETISDSFDDDMDEEDPEDPVERYLYRPYEGQLPPHPNPGCNRPNTVPALSVPPVNSSPPPPASLTPKSEHKLAVEVYNRAGLAQQGVKAPAYRPSPLGRGSSSRIDGLQ
ncbi:hypothetical protein JB92DRAFT_2977346 [Gautieria morchelliformis]|nr:hypothetical protein JB92DRAFT_2977346 [Gautieria morchelliformis]